MCLNPTYYELVLISFNALLNIAINILKKYKNSWIYTLLLLVWDRDRVLSESGARWQRTAHPLFSDIEHFAILGISRQYQFYSLTTDTYIAIWCNT